MFVYFLTILFDEVIPEFLTSGFLRLTFLKILNCEDYNSFIYLKTAQVLNIFRNLEILCFNPWLSDRYRSHFLPQNFSVTIFPSQFFLCLLDHSIKFVADILILIFIL